MSDLEREHTLLYGMVMIAMERRFVRGSISTN